MKRFLVIFILVSICLQAEGNPVVIKKHQKEWLRHKNEHNLVFDKHEDETRFQIFVSNLKQIEEINAKNLSFKCKMNFFGHMTDDEYLQFLSKEYNDENKITEEYDIQENSIEEIVDIDWREKGVVSHVKNQGGCGSCWAFSATGCLESQYAIQTGKIVTLSEQDLVDCSSQYGNGGCKGGNPLAAFKYVKAKGINNDTEYPYKAKTLTCAHDSNTSVLNISSLYRVKPGNETALGMAISIVGPISVGIDASGKEFQYYHSGVFESTVCSPQRLNHGVLAVGIGSEPQEHYIVKNSWGTKWGNQGYILMRRNFQNMCGISSLATYATVIPNLA